MANHTNSNLAVGQAKLTQAFQDGELRYREPAIWKSLVKNQPLSTPGYEALRTREDRAYQVDYFNRTSRALGTARAGTHAGTQGDTSLVNPSFATSTDKFFTSLKQADRSTRSLQEELNNELQNSAMNMVEGLNQDSSDFLFTNRSAINGVAVEGAFNGTNDAYEISDAAGGDRSVQITRMVMDLLKYQGKSFDFYCDSISFNKFEYLRNQGSSNDKNTEFQFTNGSLTFYHMGEMDTDVAAIGSSDYTRGFWLVVPKGMAVALDWIPKQNREGVSASTIGGVAEYGSIINPIDGLPYATHKYWEKADTTATNGMTQDVKEEFELSIDVAFEKAPLTNATESVIQAFAIIA